MLKHVLKSQQFDRERLDEFLREARKIEELLQSGAGRACLRELGRNRLLIAFFYEPSTRTRISFESAAYHLGMNVIGTENAREFSSAAKGERLEHSIRVINGYRPDVIVLRYHEEGGVERAAAISAAPLINAGDGKGQHPTQALVDIFTDWRLRGRNGGNYLIGGDLLNGRTARSLAYMLGKFPEVDITFVSAPMLRMREDVTQYLDRHGIPHRWTEHLEEALPHADVIYWTRSQGERMDVELKRKLEAIRDRYVIRESHLSLLKKDAIILHPLPIDGEIEAAVDHSPYAKYFKQSDNGLPVRILLLMWILGKAPRY